VKKNVENCKSLQNHINSYQKTTKRQKRSRLKAIAEVHKKPCASFQQLLFPQNFLIMYLYSTGLSTKSMPYPQFFVDNSVLTARLIHFLPK